MESWITGNRGQFYTKILEQNIIDEVIGIDEEMHIHKLKTLGNRMEYSVGFHQANVAAAIYWQKIGKGKGLLQFFLILEKGIYLQIYLMESDKYV